MRTPPSRAEVACKTASEANGTAAWDYDVVVIGGAFSGCASALLIKGLAPRARILVVERREAHERKVGEATVEVSGCFLHRQLGLYDYLSQEHLPKHGLRFWFTDRPDRPLSEMSEVGPAEQPRLPSFQLDRAKLDEHLVARAVDAGCDVERPARVRSIVLGWPVSDVTIELAGEAGGRRSGAGSAPELRKLRARWVVDASGRRTFIARMLDLRYPVPAHPTTAMWARWEGVQDLDSEAVQRAGALPPVAASRRLATNHFCGYGWWCWVIPLKGGHTSIGLVFNRELMSPPEARRAQESYEAFVKSQPGLRELLQGASICAGDFMMLKHLPYATKAYAGKGWALVGDAASFMDPYYSPGLDHGAFTCYATARLVAGDLNGELPASALEAALTEHNQRFLRSYERWLSALYLDKYELLGDAELVTCAYWLDTAGYFLGIVGPVYANSAAFANPAFGIALPQARIAYELMRFVNRRLLALARQRRKSGRYGQRNAGWRCLSAPFATGLGAVPPLLRGISLLARLEALALFDRLAAWRRPKSAKLAVPG